jgi:hypothetical protein
MILVMIAGSHLMALGWYLLHCIALYFVLSIVSYPS